MYYLHLMLFLFYYHGANSISVEETELIFTFMVTRHGDRTPWEKNIKYSNDPTALTGLIQPYGYGQLIDAGKTRSYDMGVSIRTLYPDLLSSTYDPSEIYVRSTFGARTIMTALYALAGIYSLPIEQWTETMDWIPVPYTAVLPKYDHLIPFINCPAYIDATDRLTNSSTCEMSQFSSLFDELSPEVGDDLNTNPFLIYSLNDLFATQKSLGLALSEKVEELLPEIEVAATKAMEILRGNETLIAFETGVLLNEFITMASVAAAGNTAPKMFLYSAHDLNVYALMVATKINLSPSPPKFGAVYALELRKETSTEEYYVVPMYSSSPGDDVMYPTIDGCETLCGLNQFLDIISEYVLDVDEWRTNCGWDDSLLIPECGFE